METPIAVMLLGINSETIAGLAITAIVVIGILMLPFIGGPILLKIVFWAKVNPDPQTYDPHQYPPPQDVSDHLNSVFHEMRAIGFEPTAHFVMLEAVANVDLMAMYMQNVANQDAALASVVITRSTDMIGRRIQSHTVEFSTSFIDGTQVDTNNTKEENPLVIPKTKTVYQFSEVASIARLYQLHQCAMAEHACQQKKPLPTGNYAAMISKEVVEDFTYQIEHGIMKIDSSQSKFVPTWLGAFRFAWLSMFPFKQIRRSARRKKNNAVLRRWGV